MKTIRLGRLASVMSLALAAGLLAASWAPPAWAVSSYARQTGLSCNTCHTAFPQLTPFGRKFKMDGYTLSTQSDSNADLGENLYAPMAAMLETSYSKTAKAQPDSGTSGKAQNGNVAFPDQFSFFYAGRINRFTGSFIQITYEGESDHFGFDNAEIRMAGHGKWGSSNVTYGLTVNNSPTVADPWNSTPVWGYPFAGSPAAPTPGAAAQVDGTLGQQVAGIGGYLWLNDAVYVEVAGYRNSQVGASLVADSGNETVVAGLAPYWRLAYEWGSDSQSWEVGTFGLRDKVYPGGGTTLSGPTDRFNDVAVDTQYQYFAGNYSITVHGVAIRERQHWDASYPAGDAMNPSTTLDTRRLDGSLVWNNRYGGTLGLFETTGSSDSGLYAPDPVEGSRTGSPDSRGWIAEADYMPSLNTRVMLQYVKYSRFNGASANYDGFGRAAGDNDTLYLNLWIVF